MGRVFGILAIFLILIFCGVGFAAISIDSPTDGFDTNNINFNFVIATSTIDLNYYCFNFDSNCQTNTIQISSEQPQNISYTSTGLPNLEEGSNLVFVCEHDGNTQTTSDWACQSITINYDSIAPTVTYNIIDGNAYNSSNLPAAITITISGHAGSPIINLDGVEKGISIPKAEIFEGTHIITVDANDEAGNRLQDSITFVYDTNAPSGIGVSSAYSTNYTNDPTPTFNLSATDTGSGMTGGKAFLSCTSGGPWKEFTFATTYSDFNILSSDFNCPATDGNRTVFAKFSDRAGNETTTTSTIVKYDGTPPSTPTGLTSSVGDRKVTLSWTAPQPDNLSNNAGYKIYKNEEYVATATTTSYTIESLTNNVSYAFRVSTIDNAGNESGKTASLTAIPQQQSLGNQITVKRSGAIVEYAKPNDTLTIACTTDEDVDNLRIKYRYDTESVKNLTSEEDDTDALSETISLDDYDQVKFWCTWNYNNSAYTSTEKTIIIDKEAPKLEWFSFGSTLTGTQKISFEATDNKYLDRTELYIGTEKLVLTKKSNEYYMDLDTNKYSNGNYVLKAIGYDRAGNTKEITKNMTISNELTPEQERNQAITSAQQRKKGVEDLIIYYNSEGLSFNENWIVLKEEADALLDEAIDSISVLDAVTKADLAKAKYTEINTNATIIAISTDNVFPEGTILEALQFLGYNGDIETISNITSAANIVRTISIVKTGDTYQAQIELRLRNDTNENVLKVIEIIPKEFAQSASKITSNLEFNIIQDDPIIEFIIPVAQGAETTINYSVGGLNEEQANAIKGSAKFSAPIVTKETDIIQGGIKIDFVAIIAILIIIIVIAALGVGAIAMMNGKGSSIVKEHGTKIVSKITKTDNNKSPGKWKYK